MFRAAAALSLLALGQCLVLEAPPQAGDAKVLDAWKTLKTYKAKPVCAANKQQFQVQEGKVKNLIRANRQCPSMGAQFPTLISNDAAARKDYETHVCASQKHHPIADLAAQVAVLNDGCFEGSVFSAKKAWNATHVVPLSHTDEASKAAQKELRKVESDVIVLPSSVEFAYQKVLSEFVPQAYTVFDYVKKNDLKFLVKSKMQMQLLKNLGVPQHHILNEIGKDSGVCVAKGRKMHVVRMHNAAPKQLNHRVGPQLAASALDFAKQQIEKSTKSSSEKQASLAKLQSAKPAVVFIKQCKSKDALANEDQALESVKKVMGELGREEELVSFCDTDKSFGEVVNMMHRAKLVVGAHGGAMSNLMFAKPSCDTHVIEFVGDAETNKAKGLEPYASYYHGGVGSRFAYKVVLLKPAEAKKMKIDLSDFETALRQVWYDAHSEI